MAEQQNGGSLSTATSPPSSLQQQQQQQQQQQEGKTSSRVGEQRRNWRLVKIVFLAVLIAAVSLTVSKTSLSCVSTDALHTTVITTTEDDDKKTHNHTVYCHVHIAKTAGTTLNGHLALHYERVCGHKGYSFMYNRYNKLLAADPEAQKEVMARWDHIPVEQQSPSYRLLDRGRFPHAEMDQYGYENCDYISWERRFEAWLGRAGQRTPLFPSEPGVHYEMHLPCRDPVGHFISRCNFHQVEFDCTKPFVPQMRECDVGRNRFSSRLNETYDLRCFDALQLDAYLEYMDDKLTRKRDAFTTEHVHRDSNIPRSKPSCLQLEQYASLRSRVERWLLKNEDYYSFCHECMGSWQELQLETRDN